jgi:hypothetical protein
MSSTDSLILVQHGRGAYQGHYHPNESRYTHISQTVQTSISALSQPYLKNYSRHVMMQFHLSALADVTDIFD